MIDDSTGIKDRNGNVVDTLHGSTPALRVAVCPSKSVDIEGFTEQRVYAQVESLYEP